MRALLRPQQKTARSHAPDRRRSVSAACAARGPSRAFRAAIVPVPGCYVRLTQSAAYAVTSIGGVSSGISRDDLSVINRGVQRASLLIPHTENL